MIGIVCATCINRLHVTCLWSMLLLLEVRRYPFAGRNISLSLWIRLWSYLLYFRPQRNEVLLTWMCDKYIITERLDQPFECGIGVYGNVATWIVP